MKHSMASVIAVLIGLCMPIIAVGSPLEIDSLIRSCNCGLVEIPHAGSADFKELAEAKNDSSKLASLNKTWKAKTKAIATVTLPEDTTFQSVLATISSYERKNKSNFTQLSSLRIGAVDHLEKEQFLGWSKWEFDRLRMRLISTMAENAPTGTHNFIYQQYILTAVIADEVHTYLRLHPERAPESIRDQYTVSLPAPPQSMVEFGKGEDVWWAIPLTTAAKWGLGISAVCLLFWLLFMIGWMIGRIRSNPIEKKPQGIKIESIPTVASPKPAPIPEKGNKKKLSPKVEQLEKTVKELQAELSNLATQFADYRKAMAAKPDFAASQEIQAPVVAPVVETLPAAVEAGPVFYSAAPVKGQFVKKGISDTFDPKKHVFEIRETGRNQAEYALIADNLVQDRAFKMVDAFIRPAMLMKGSGKPQPGQVSQQVGKLSRNGNNWKIEEKATLKY
ncbi:hypothetical protein [Pontibacter sp. G13]|uniref:hypothetical protein n=1 Tax=Pontibacter sp. G13 TaxID=3074898 RepID=UPI0028893CA6|nr:hypothetical protein [Pontibacter sp. G13]WNJ20049.1 hypothetical protein RJD25_06155 [Pontibacter sp. G13]